MHVAVLGMGNMGRAMAERLLDRGYDVTVWNRTASRAAPLGDRGARVAESVEDAVRDAPAVIVMLSDDDAVQSVAGEVRGALSPDATFINSSTVSRDLTGELDAQFSRFVAAPVVGAPAATASGQATLFVGGRQEVVEPLNPLWNDLSGRVVNCGTAEDAASLKLMNNLLLIGGVALMDEVVATARALGLSDDRLRAIFGESPVVSAAVRARLDPILDPAHPGWFSVDLSEKDARLIIELARSQGLTLRTAEGARADLQAASAAGHGDVDLAGVIEGLAATEAPAHQS